MVSIWTILQRTFKEWSTDKASRLAAALSYYTAVAIAPMLVLLVTVVGFFFWQGFGAGPIGQPIARPGRAIRGRSGSGGD